MITAVKYRLNGRIFLAAVLVALCLAGMAAAGSAIWFSLGARAVDSNGYAATADIGATPMPETFKFQEGIAPEDAQSLNAAVPDSDEPIIAALPLTAGVGQTQLRAIDCLTAAVYFEAASESAVGQRSVAQVVLNRARHPAYPNSICGVVFQGSNRVTGCQFSFTCDGSLSRRPSAYGWARARQVAAMALSGFVEPSVGLATHYHTTSVVPYWSASLTKLRTVGAHIFYRWNGSNGTSRAFTRRYANMEVMPDSLAANLPGYLLAASASTDLLSAASAAEIANLSIPSANESDVTIKPEKFVRRQDSNLTASALPKPDLLVDSKAALLNEGKSSLLMDRKQQ